MFKKPSKFAKGEEETQVHSTLLEYGQRFNFSGSKSKQEETEAKQKAIAAGLVKVKDGDSAEANEEEERKLKLLMEGMSETDLQQVVHHGIRDPS